MFAIQRYVVALDILAGILLVLPAARLAPRRVALPLATDAALLAVGTTRPADWWYRPWSDPFVAAPPPELATPAAYLVLFHPIEYWASALPAAARFHAIAPNSLATGVCSATLVLKPATSASPLLLELDLSQDGPDRASEVEVTADKQNAMRLQAPDMPAGRTSLICLLPSLDPPARVARVTFGAVAQTGSDTRLALTLRTMRLRQARTGECGR